MRNFVSTFLVSLFILAVVGSLQAQVVMQFPVTRDVGIAAHDAEKFTNTGAEERLRGAKFNQHAALFDFDTAAIKAFVDANPGVVSATLNIYPLGTPNTDVDILTVESLIDWVEGDASGVGCCTQFGWTEGTLAVTQEYAQTARTGDMVDVDNSVEWQNDEDGSRFTLLNRGGGGMHTPNLTNSRPLAVASWAENQFISTPLDASILDALTNDPNNRGLMLDAPDNGSNWQMAARERAGGSQAAFLEVTIAAEPTAVPSLSQWGLLALVATLVMAGARALHRTAPRGREGLNGAAPC